MNGPRPFQPPGVCACALLASSTATIKLITVRVIVLFSVGSSIMCLMPNRHPKNSPHTPGTWAATSVGVDVLDALRTEALGDRLGDGQLPPAPPALALVPDLELLRHPSLGEHPPGPVERPSRRRVLRDLAGLGVLA